MKLVKEDPNVSIVLPGPCNSKCEFCFWKEDKNVPETYLKQVKAALDKLPKQFWQISITGGEPMLSPYLEGVLDLIDKERWPKVVLTTNGTKLLEKCEMLDKVDHINISRHHYTDEINRRVYGNEKIPGGSEVAMAIDKLNRMGIDATLSCVLTEYMGSLNDVHLYIKAAKVMGASSIYLRHKVGSLEASELEREFSDYRVVNELYCPVCRSSTQLIRGMYVVWKASTVEPSLDSDGVYEAIIQSNGEVTVDWDGNQRFELDEEDVLQAAKDLIAEVKPRNTRMPDSGCGTSAKKVGAGCGGASGC